MNPEGVTALMEKASRSVEAAQELMNREDYDFAVSRLYYALFYGAEALLLSMGLSFSSHSAVMSGLYEHFVKGGRLPKKMHQLLHEAFDLRQEADYEVRPQFTQEQVLSLVARAREYLSQIERIL